MIDSNETIMYDNGWRSGYDLGYDEGYAAACSRHDMEMELLIDWLEQKTYKLNNQDSIRAYQTVIDKIKRDFGLEE